MVRLLLFDYWSEKSAIDTEYLDTQIVNANELKIQS